MILITGAAGVMGSSLMKSLHEKGYKCRALVLENDPNAERIKDFADEIIYGDITKPETIKYCCKDVDTVYHLAAIIISYEKKMFTKVNVNGTQNILNEALKDNVRHFIYISSASVVYPKTNPYSRSKIACEKMIKQSGLNYTIIRPTLVYDFGKGSIEFDAFLNYLKAFPVVPFIGRGNAIKRPVRVDALKKGLTSICNATIAYGKIYNFSGSTKITMKDFAKLCLSLLNKKNKPIMPVPVFLCRFMAFVMGIFMKKPPLRWQVISGVIQDADLNPNEAIKETGFTASDIYKDLPECFPRN
jgi:NADH dehydrogenase